MTFSRTAGLGLILVLAAASTVYSQDVLQLATTTSVDNSGLLDVLLPPFEERLGVKVAVIAVGTGKAFKLAENGDVDVVIIHDPAGEDRFVRQGFGVNRRDFMFNHFLIAGPPDDPASVGDSKNVVEAFRRIASTGVPFVSRGDDSGTHRKERSIWSDAGIRPDWDVYLEVGQGMGASLLIADEKSGYILTDQATFDAFEAKLGRLKKLLTGGERLYNPYSIIAVNPARWPESDYLMAMALVGWVTSPEGQQLIADYRVGRDPLFRPLAVRDEP